MVEFSPQRAMDYTRLLARPRLVGSGEDERVAKEVADRLRGWGWQVEREPFEFVTASETLIVLELVISQLLIVAALVWNDVTGVKWVVAAGLFLLALAARPLNRAARLGSLLPNGGDQREALVRTRSWRGKRHRSANLLARLPGPYPTGAPELLLVAHYDSKSQPIPIAVRIGLFVVTIAGALGFAALTLMSLTLPALGNVARITGMVTVLAATPLLFLRAGNASPGAIDNGSGLGLVLHLAEVLANRPEPAKAPKVSVLITGAEELSVMGATEFVRRHGEELRRQAATGGLQVLNFDGVGVAGELRFVGKSHGALLARLRRAGAGARLRLTSFGLPGALYDHIPFAEAGFDAVSLVGIGPASWRVHTPSDDVAGLDASGFERAGRVALTVIEDSV